MSNKTTNPTNAATTATKAQPNVQTATATAAPPTEPEKVKKDPNKGVYACKFLCAKVNKNGDKVGVACLDFSGMLPSGQPDVLGIDSPVVSKWFDLNTAKAPAYLLSLVEVPPYTEVGCLLSGEGDFTQLHEILSPEEFAMYLRIVGRA